MGLSVPARSGVVALVPDGLRGRLCAASAFATRPVSAVLVAWAGGVCGGSAAVLLVRVLLLSYTAVQYSTGL